MGNDNTSFELRREYEPVSNNIMSLSGQPCYVRSKKTGLELEEFSVASFNPDPSIESHYYSLRSSSYTHALVVVFQHLLIDET